MRLSSLMKELTTTVTSTPTPPAETSSSTGWTFKEILDRVIDWCITDGVKILLGLIALFILFKITNIIASKVKKKMEAKHTDKTISVVVNGIIRKGLKIVWVILFLGFVGIETASIGSIIASLSVCTGLALQGSLSNLAGGLIILVMRPFRIGDVICAQGETGTVETIKVFYTYIVTGDNRTVMIPNGTLANGVIKNNSLKDERRVDMAFGIAYEADYDLAKKTIEDIIATYDEVLKDKAILVRMSAHLDSAVEITTRVWVKSGDYWTVYYRMLEDVKRKFEELGIEIPYNKIDVNVKKD